MKDKEILILQHRETNGVSIYQLIDNQYCGLFDESLMKIPYYEGFELMLNKPCFTIKENLDWLIDILNPEQYEKSLDLDVTYLKDRKPYLRKCLPHYNWNVDHDNIWIPFENKFIDNYEQTWEISYELFKSLSKFILEKIHNQTVSTVTVISRMIFTL